MKKYLYTLILAAMIGFFLCNFFIKQYDSYNGIKVSGYGETLYFIQYGVYSSLESMEKETINLENYVYNINDNLYYVYIGITSKKENADKIVSYYKSIGNETIIKQYEINNSKFLKELVNYDDVLANTNDNIVISSLISQIISKYEEVVING